VGLVERFALLSVVGRAASEVSAARVSVARVSGLPARGWDAPVRINYGREEPIDRKGRSESNGAGRGKPGGERFETAVGEAVWTKSAPLWYAGLEGGTLRRSPVAWGGMPVAETLPQSAFRAIDRSTTVAAVSAHREPTLRRRAVRT